MTNRLLILLLILLTFNQQKINAQPPHRGGIHNKLKHLERELQNHQQEDVKKVRLLNSYAEQLILSNSEDAPAIIEQAMSLALQLGNKEGAIGAKLNKAIFFNRNRDFHKVLTLPDSVLSEAKKLNLNKSLGDAYKLLAEINMSRHVNNKATQLYFGNAIEHYKKEPEAHQLLLECYSKLARIYDHMGNHKKAHDCYEQVVEYMKQGSGGTRLGESYIQLYIAKRKMGDMEGANEQMAMAEQVYAQHPSPRLNMLINFEKGMMAFHSGDAILGMELLQVVLKQAEETGEKHLKERTYLHMIKLHIAEKNYEEAIKYGKIILQEAEKRGHIPAIIKTNDELGRIYLHQKDYNNAYNYLNKAAQIAGEYAVQECMVSISFNLSTLYYEQGNIDKAKEYALNTVKFMDETPGVGNYGFTARRLGDIYLRLKEFGKSEYYYTKALKAFEYPENLQAKEGIYYGLFSLSKQQGKYKEALDYHELYKQVGDSIFNEENVREISRIKSQYRFDKEKQAMLAEQERKDLLEEEERKVQAIIRNSLIVVLVLILLLAVVIWQSYSRKRKANRLLSHRNKEIEEQAAQLKHAHNQLIKLDEFKQDMTGMIVHDLKNPLNVIINSSKTEPQLALKMARQSGKQMLNMVLNILDVYKAEAAKISLDLANYTLSTILNNAIESVDYLIEQKNIILDVNKNTAYNIRVDGQLIERVLINLLTNAIKYTPLNGTITIGVKEADSLLKVSISDSGEGIAEEKKHLVFDKFAQAKAKRSGSVRSTGLGLTFCKMAVETHGGEIDFESEKGKGATFWFTLQLAEHAEKINKGGNKQIRSNDVVKELSIEDMAYLNPYVEQLKEVLVYESSEVEAVLSDIETGDNAALIHWKKSVLDCVYTMNQERYTELLEN